MTSRTEEKGAANRRVILVIDGTRRVTEKREEGRRLASGFGALQGYKMAWTKDIPGSLTIRQYDRNVQSSVLKLIDSAKAVARLLVR